MVAGAKAKWFTVAADLAIVQLMGKGASYKTIANAIGHSVRGVEYRWLRCLVPKLSYISGSYDDKKIKWVGNVCYNSYGSQVRESVRTKGWSQKVIKNCLKENLSYCRIAA